tara:strand:+ start:119 stop:439 length:321 start_codon:yes stop_codon:yes gene_type:complete
MKLRDHNVHSIDASFSGGGDEGAIDEILFLDHKGGLIDIPIPKQYELDEFIYNAIDTCTMYTGDWINNDGGHGTISINLEENTYNVECSFYRYETDDYVWEEEPFM